MSPATGRSGPRGSGWVKAPNFFTFQHYKGGRSSAKSTSRIYPGKIPGTPFQRLSRPQSTRFVLSVIPKRKIASDAKGHHSRNLQTSSAVP